jgi:hypothetical protein
MRSISYPFKITAGGKIGATNNPSKIYLDRVLTLMSTITRQRYMRPRYGLDISRGMYENLGDFEEGMESAIREAMAVWLPELSLKSYESDGPNEQGLVEITLGIGLPNNSNATVSFKTYNITPEGVITNTGTYS